VCDNSDDFITDPEEQIDSDGDGVGDNADLFPQDANEHADSDGDGIGDNADACASDDTETLDTDEDGVCDGVDAFPFDPTEQFDTDEDGYGNNVDDLDAFPDDGAEWFDYDNDSVGNNADAFDNDPSETIDSDGDGVGDNADKFPQDSAEQHDIDNDGIGDNADTDNDNDNTPDATDAFPRDPTEQLDTDNDGVGNNTDLDDDNDLVADRVDAFPLLASESVDIDEDGIGDNADTDDDNDGVEDTVDVFPYDPLESVDTDNDGLGNNADNDDDNDGYPDSVEIEFASDSLDSASLPQGLDMDRDTLADSIERGFDIDGDGIANEFDVDSDNDGVFDLLEASAQPKQAALLDADGDGSMDTEQLHGLTRVAIPVDTDKDGIRDFRDLDSDNDGLSDRLEITSVAGDFTQINNLQSDAVSQVLADPDADGLVNYRDLDSDNDGRPDIIEAGGDDIDSNGLADDFLDINADGMDDSYFNVPLALLDTDGDGDQDYVDLDSDNDGQFDINESGLFNPDIDADGRLDITTDSNGDGIYDYADVTFTNGVDSDGDGIDDRVDASILGESDVDSDGIADQYDVDIEGDGFVQITGIKIPDNAPPAIVPITQPVVVPPVVEPEPAAATPSAPAVATTSIGGGGCSAAGTASQPDMMLTILLVFSMIYVTLLRVGTLRTLKRLLLVFISTALAAGPTVADVHAGLYLGIGGGASRLMPGVENAPLDSRDSVGSAWNATAGYQLSRKLGVEFEYADLGTTVLEPIGSIDYQDFNVSGLYHLGGVAQHGEGRKFSLFGRLGVGTVANQSDIELHRKSSAHWLAGAGVQVPLGRNLSLRAEGINYDADASRAGMTLTYHMGRPTQRAIAPIVENENIDEQIIDKQKIAELETLPTTSNTLDTTDTIEVPKEESLAIDQPVAAEDEDGAVAEDEYLVLNAKYVEPHPKEEAMSIEQMMKVDEAPKKRWMLSESTLTKMHGKPSVDTNLNLNSAQDTAVSTGVSTGVSTAVDTADDKVKETTNNTLDTSMATLDISEVKLPEPIMAEALPEATEQMTQPVLFGFDQDTVAEQYKKQLSPLINYLRLNPAAKVTLTGHTDNIGTTSYNQALSVRRADAVRDYLLQQGIDREMIRVLGAGEKRPVKSNANAAGRNANRRVSIVMD